MSTHIAKCDKCSYGADFSDPLRSYEMPDGTTISMRKTFVWCRVCREVRWGEELAELAEYERELVATTARDSIVLEELSFSVSRDKTLEQLLTARTQDLQAQIAWRRRRSSPPRCLECGSSEIATFVYSETEAEDDMWTLKEHPGCGGSIRVLRKMVITLDRRWFRYTPEGERKQAYEMYPYKGAVPIDG